MHRGEEERNKELSMGGVCMLTGTQAQQTQSRAAVNDHIFFTPKQ